MSICGLSACSLPGSCLVEVESCSRTLLPKSIMKSIHNYAHMFQTYFSLQSSKSWNQFLLVLQIQIARNSCYISILFTMQPTSPSYESDASDTQLNYFTYHQFLFKLIPIILTFIVIQNGSKFSIQIWFVHISSTLQPLGTK